MEDCMKKNQHLREMLSIPYNKAEDRRMCRNWLRYFIHNAFINNQL